MQPVATHLEIAEEDDFVVFGEGVEDKKYTDSNETRDGNLQAKVYLATLRKSHQLQRFAVEDPGGGGAPGACPYTLFSLNTVLFTFFGTAQ